MNQLNDFTHHIIVKLDFAIFEAERFIKKAKEAQKALKAGTEDSYRSKSFAAAKRASLDLSSSLATLRHSNYDTRMNEKGAL